MAKTQIQKFRETARALEADESEERFGATLKKIAKTPPPKTRKAAKPKTKAKTKR